MLSDFDAYRKKKTFNAFALWMLSLALFHAVVFNPIYLWVTNDVLLSGTVLSLALNTLADLLNYVFYWVAFSFLVFVATRFRFSSSWGVFAIFGGSMALRYSSNLLSGYIMMGFPLAEDVLNDLLFGVLLVTVLDLCLMGFAILLVYLLSMKKHEPRNALDNLFLSAMPPASFWKLSHPILKATFALSCIPSAMQILYRAYLDITLLGAPTDLVDLLWMLAYYLADLAAILLGYFIMQLFLNQFHMAEVRALEQATTP